MFKIKHLLDKMLKNKRSLGKTLFFKPARQANVFINHN